MRAMYSAMMTMRAEVTRNTSGKDVYGHQKAPGATTVADGIPCFIWIKTQSEILDGKSVVVEVIKAYFRHDADVLREDRVLQIKDRRDRVIHQGPFVVEMVAEKSLGASPSHKEVSLRRIRG